MRQLNFPTYSFSIQRKGDKLQIYDILRKKWIFLTPEEWVRQHIVHYLINDKRTPQSLIAIEKSLKINNLTKRFDLVVFNKKGEPLVLIECKAPEIKITEDTLHQALRYNSVLKAPFILLSNGLDTYFGELNFTNHSFSYLNDVPNYTDLT